MTKRLMFSCFFFRLYHVVRSVCTPQVRAILIAVMPPEWDLSVLRPDGK